MLTTQEKTRQKITVQGMVQGVGFRPFVYRLAGRMGVQGTVSNTGRGVSIVAQADRGTIDRFKAALSAEAPPAARVVSITAQELTPDLVGDDSFVILNSQKTPNARTLVGPDLATCDACLAELFSPSDRRYRYPFINCTHCGPRFTIICDIPYDRPLTTMADFEMCPACLAEYREPDDRRFHAQPNACPDCGPQLWLEAKGMTIELGPGDDPFHHLGATLRQGAIVAIKGIGGFHLACDATNDRAVATLRERKGRPDKPLAVMAADIDTIKGFGFAQLTRGEEHLLQRAERSIVLLSKRENGPLSKRIAPGHQTIGVMLPYTPIHHLLLAELPLLVMTSANQRGEPIVATNAAARQRLNRLADLLLMHDRRIENRCDDAVIRAMPVADDCDRPTPVMPIRRARGYAPFPVQLHRPVPPILAVGGELKATFCITKGDQAFMGPHIGDMVNIETVNAFEAGVDRFKQLFRLEPVAIASDRHPGYLSTAWATRATTDRQPLIKVQHHHAHIAALMAEHQLSGRRPIIGFAFDGTGYGADGAIWGGEVLIADYAGYERPFHLDYLPLAGGDATVKRPYRMALAHLAAANIDWEPSLPPVMVSPPAELALYRQQLAKGINSLPTSSMGRLFDAVAALIGLRQQVSYEGQAAMELEAIVDPQQLHRASGYRFEIDAGRFSAAPLIKEIVSDCGRKLPLGTIAARFHLGLADLICELANRVRRQSGLRQVGLSGGVFQNLILLNLVIPRLQAAGFETFIHAQVPPNDGGLALGQALIAAQQLD